MNFTFTKTVTQEIPFPFSEATQEDMDEIVDELTSHVFSRCSSKQYLYFLKALKKFVVEAEKGGYNLS